MDYLIVDMVRILDESAAGKAATAELNKRWQAAQKELGALSERVAAGDDDAMARAADLEANFPQAMAAERQRMQSQLALRAKAIIDGLAVDRGIPLVLAADQVVAHAPEAEITDAVISALDAQ